MSKIINDLQMRYISAAHAVQSGVAHLASKSSTGLTKDMDPKHLRVGVNSALVDSGALAGLLISKGLITEEEYYEALAEGMEREQAAYENRCGVKLA